MQIYIKPKSSDINLFGGRLLFFSLLRKLYFHYHKALRADSHLFPRLNVLADFIDILFYLKVKDYEQRTKLLAYLKEKGVGAVFHYIPLHTAPAGQKFGRFHGEDKYTTKESERLIRLPMYYGLKNEEIEYAAQCVFDYFNK